MMYKIKCDHCDLEISAKTLPVILREEEWCVVRKFGNVDNFPIGAYGRFKKDDAESEEGDCGSYYKKIAETYKRRCWSCPLCSASNYIE